MKRSIRIIVLIIVIVLGIELVPGSVFAESKLGEIMPETEDISNKDIGVHTVSELLFLREENRKTYRLSDGSEAVAEYEKPVHYKSGDEWLEVDSSLYTTKDKDDKKPNNCAFYSSLRYYQMSGRVFSGDWYDSTRTSQIPKAGSIAYFGSKGNSHYVFVEYVYGNIIVFSEANWNQNNDFQYQMLTTDEFINRGSKPFQGFLY